MSLQDGIIIRSMFFLTRVQPPEDFIYRGQQLKDLYTSGQQPGDLYIGGRQPEDIYTFIFFLAVRNHILAFSAI